MTPTTRTRLKRAVDAARRAHAAALIADYGAESCDHCGTAIMEPKPRKHFCSTRCCKRWHEDVLIRAAA